MFLEPLKCLEPNQKLEYLFEKKKLEIYKIMYHVILKLKETVLKSKLFKTLKIKIEIRAYN